ncbi:putative phage tail protein [uncultured Endozoicomonas sp.]|uniref:YmfQ family protein n=1 Tax=uncultured Endozoicomonas sp. TaxID=432652 RepID=UPI00261FD426|nr:putative phage tail protein [uncultured Endozoicomonas sp.]
MALNAQAFHQALKALLPRGIAWPEDQDTVMDNLLAGLAEEPARVMHQAEQLRRELIPDHARELLNQWEQTLDQQPGQKSLTERQASVSQQLRAVGTLNPKYYVEIARQLGYIITLTEHQPARAGTLCAGQPANGAGWGHASTVNAPETTARLMVAGDSAGYPLQRWGNEALESGVRRYWPAHLVLTFAYGGSDVTRTV